MYLAFYGLKKEPFHTTPDPNFLYLSPSHKEAMGAIIYGIERRKGFIAIFGEVGVGKTTIIRAYLEQTSDRKQKTVYILNPMVSFQDLLADIFRSLDIIPTRDDSAEMVNQLQEVLINEYRSDSTVVLVIDEAQNMPVKTLEQLRLLSNLETSTDKLIQIVLIGQPELHTILEHPTLKSLNQRIALRATIQPLKPKESHAYIEHRVALASVTGAPIFTDGAVKLIVREAQGIPRKLNILCDNALITGYGKQQKPVSISEVREIISDMDTSQTPHLMRWVVGVAAVLLLAIGTFMLSPAILSENKAVLPLPTNLDKTGKAGDNADGGPINGVSQGDTQNDSRFISETRLNPTNPSGPIENIGSGSNPESAGQVAKTLEPANTNSSSNDQPLSQAPSSQLASNSVRQKNQAPVSRQTRAVKEGENLSQIASEAYGSSKMQYVEWVRKHNPHIVDPNIILPGQKIILPEYNQE